MLADAGESHALTPHCCAREEDVSQSKRFQSCVSLVRALAQDRVDPESGKVLVRKVSPPLIPACVYFTYPSSRT